LRVLLPQFQFALWVSYTSHFHLDLNLSIQIFRASSFLCSEHSILYSKIRE
jgi:hypothetical protein